MSERAGKTSPLELDGTLRWNEFEGGFWSLELAEEHPEVGANVVLNAFTPPSDAHDGTPVRMRLVPRHDLVDFTMAGVRGDVLKVEPRC